MTEATGDMLAWGTAGAFTVLFIALLVWGLRLPKGGAWISAEEKLPISNDTVRVYDGRDQYDAFYEPLDDAWIVVFPINECDSCFDRAWEMLNHNPITHWMPLPEPPKGQP